MTSVTRIIDRMEGAVAGRTPLDKEHVQTIFFMFPLFFFIGAFILCRCWAPCTTPSCGMSSTWKRSSYSLPISGTSFPTPV